MKILITGGTGFIGRNLIPALLKEQHQVIVLTRSYIKGQKLFGDSVTLVENLKDISGQEIPQAVINLAGEAIADRRWSKNRKQLLRTSRIEFTKTLVDWILINAPNLNIMISGSAMGYYGSQAPHIKLTEHSNVVDGFTHRLCKDWESQTSRLEKNGCRVCLLRTGLVLSKDGGALAKMLTPFRLGLGGPIASGEQVMSWIHMQDMVNGILFLLNDPTLNGPFNLTAPNPASNQMLTRTLAKILHRPTFFTVPEFVLKLLLGEGSELLVKGQCVLPERLIKAGFNFKHTELEEALLASLLTRPV